MTNLLSHELTNPLIVYILRLTVFNLTRSECKRRIATESRVGLASTDRTSSNLSFLNAIITGLDRLKAEGQNVESQ